MNTNELFDMNKKYRYSQSKTIEVAEILRLPLPIPSWITDLPEEQVTPTNPFFAYLHGRIISPLMCVELEEEAEKKTPVKKGTEYVYVFSKEQYRKDPFVQEQTDISADIVIELLDGKEVELISEDLGIGHIEGAPVHLDWCVKQEKPEECSYCKEILPRERERELASSDGICFDREADVYYIYIEHFRNERNRLTEITHCPYCGRKLI